MVSGHNSFAAAGRHLGETASAISRKIRRLEDSIGVSLFERHSGGIRLTPAGQRFNVSASQGISLLDIGIRMAAQEGRGESGGASIGLVTTLAGGILRGLLESFKAKYPTLALRIQSGNREEQIEALRNSVIDLLFLPGQDAGEDFDTQMVGNERIYVALSKNHPLSRYMELTWYQIRGETFLLPRSGAGPEVHGYIIRRVSEFSTLPNVTFQDLPLDEVMHLVAMNDGVSIVTEGWTHIQAPNLEFRPLDQPSEIIPLFAVWSPKRDNPALRRFVSHLRSFSRSSTMSTT